MNEPIHILFVCHGNICRSPLAEFVMKDLVRRAGVEERFVVASAATRTDEIGSDVYPPTRRCMDAHGVPYERRAARQLTRSDTDAWDYIIGMDNENIRDMKRMLGREGQAKIHKLMEFAGAGGAGAGGAGAGSVDAGGNGTVPNVADPWYTGDFERTYEDVLAGCQGLLAQLLLDTGTSVPVSKQ